MLEDRREAFYDVHFSTCAGLYPAFDELPARTLLELALTCDIVNQTISRYLAEFGISRAAFNVLVLLRSGPSEGMQLHDLGELLLVSRANVTGLMDHLERKGYVTREVPSSDRRVRRARITERAVQLLDLLMPIHHRNLREIMNGVPNADKHLLRGLLKKVRSSLLAHSESDGRTAASKLGPQTVR